MVTFKHNDRVRLVCDSTQGGDYPGEYGLKGQTGTIISKFDPSDDTYLVEFDEPVPHTISDVWADPDDNEWWCKVNELELETPPVLIYDPNQQGDTDEDI